MPTIRSIHAFDIRFPTSRHLDGSDAMNVDPDYSAAYCILRTDADDGLEGHGFTFTIGRGNELCVAAINSLAPLLVGSPIDDLRRGVATLPRLLTRDSQLRWLGPEKGVIHLAAGALTNALWDLLARREGLPLWKLLLALTPEEVVACIDFRYIDDALDPDQALGILRNLESSRARRLAELERSGLPAYTTSAGWKGYDDEKITGLARQAQHDGWQTFKLKVGLDSDEDTRRSSLLRFVLGDDAVLMLDANQVWGVEEAIERTHALRECNPLWIEEPTSPDDVLGHARIAKAVAPIGVATGEQVQNRIVFKQLFQAHAIGYCQLDACRLAGVNEVLAVILLAAAFAVPVCPHAGGVGLCELVQHLSAFDLVAAAADPAGRYVEYVDHLHEHFVDPVTVSGGRYVLPTMPGYSTEILAGARAHYRFPDGDAWRPASGRAGPHSRPTTGSSS